MVNNVRLPPLKDLQSAPDDLRFLTVFPDGVAKNVTRNTGRRDHNHRRRRKYTSMPIPRSTKMIQTMGYPQ